MFIFKLYLYTSGTSEKPVWEQFNSRGIYFKWYSSDMWHRFYISHGLLFCKISSKILLIVSSVYLVCII